MLHDPGRGAEQGGEPGWVVDLALVVGQHAPVGVAGAWRTTAEARDRRVASSPKAKSSRGTGGAKRWTNLFEETITTNWSAAAATIFSRVWAPPPPLTSHPDGSTWSAPSIAMSSREMPSNGPDRDALGPGQRLRRR